jgi:hypothetical protein
MPGALHGDSSSFQRIVAFQFFHARFHSHVNPVCRNRRRITAAAERTVDAGDVLRLHPNIFHVAHIGADIFRRDVPTGKSFDKPAEGAEERFGFVFIRIADDDGLAATQVQARDGSFVRHAARKAKHIVQRVLIRFVHPHAGAAKSRPQFRIMNRNDRLQTGQFVGTEHDLLVIALFNMFKNRHEAHFSVRWQA